jgi:hypothetical protein
MNEHRTLAKRVCGDFAWVSQTSPLGATAFRFPDLEPIGDCYSAARPKMLVWASRSTQDRHGMTGSPNTLGLAIA